MIKIEVGFKFKGKADLTEIKFDPLAWFDEHEV